MTTPPTPMAQGGRSVVPPQQQAKRGGAGLGTALPTRERRSGTVALFVAVVVGFAGAGAYFYNSAGSKVAVVEVVNEVRVGQVLQRGDLTTVQVSGAVTAFGANRLDGLVGQRAATTIFPHTLLQRAMVTQGQTLAAGQAEVGVAVTSGQIPADGLQPGDVVRVVQLPNKDAAGTSGPAATPTVLTPRATVFSSVQDPSASGATLLTLVVPDAVGDAVAAASGAGLVALVKVPGGPS